MILYRDPAKDAKLKEAIERGFITQTVGADGVCQYTLTHAGMLQYVFEKGGVSFSV